MYHFEQGGAVVIASDYRSTLTAVDDAIINSARLIGSIAEVARQSGLGAADSQRLYDSLSHGMSSVVRGRGDIVESLRQATILKRHSNLEPVDLGCANPLKVFTTGVDAEQPVAAVQP